MGFLHRKLPKITKRIYNFFLENYVIFPSNRVEGK